jgi:prepilin-type N-terminal cleavage/methylation domain-containing protein
MKYGFSLIELMLALFISSAMILSLYQMLTQTRRTVSRITQVIDVDTPLMALYSQLEKDVTGMFASHAAEKPYIDKELKKLQEKNNKKQAASQQTASAAQQQPNQKQNQQDPVVVIEQRDGALLWSFITTGALSTLDRDGKLSIAPYVRRVAYVIERDPMNSEVMRLMYRYSAENTSVKAIQDPKFNPSYELASAIKNVTVEFTVYEFVEEKAETPAPDTQTKKADDRKASTTLKEWKEQDIWDKYKSLIPAYVTIRGSQLDAASKREYPFTFTFKVLSYEQYKPKLPPPAAPEPSGDPLKKLQDWAKNKLPESLDKVKAANGGSAS